MSAAIGQYLDSRKNPFAESNKMAADAQKLGHAVERLKASSAKPVLMWQVMPALMSRAGAACDGRGVVSSRGAPSFGQITRMMAADGCEDTEQPQQVDAQFSLGLVRLAVADCLRYQPVMPDDSLYATGRRQKQPPQTV